MAAAISISVSRLLPLLPGISPAKYALWESLRRYARRITILLDIVSGLQDGCQRKNALSLYDKTVSSGVPCKSDGRKHASAPSRESELAGYAIHRFLSPRASGVSICLAMACHLPDGQETVPGATPGDQGYPPRWRIGAASQASSYA